MKKTTSVKSKPKFAKKRGNSKQSDTKKPDVKNKTTVKPVDREGPDPELSQQKVAIETTPPPADAPPEVRIGGPTPEVRPCSPAETQKGHHEVVVT